MGKCPYIHDSRSSEHTISFSYKVVFMVWDSEGENFEHAQDFISVENEHSEEEIKQIAAKELGIEPEDIIEIISN